MSLANVKAFVFDLDGTLIDTEKIYRNAWPQAMEKLGYVFKDEQFLFMRSLGRPFAPKLFREWYGEDFDYDGARKERQYIFEAYVKEHGIQLKKGAVELLKFLKERGIVTSIATATGYERAVELLEYTGLYGYFNRVISATMVDEGKPSPKIYSYACRELGFEPEECVAVEDAPNGVISANEAGLKVVMVPDLTQPDDELMGRLYRKVDSLDQIIGLF